MFLILELIDLHLKVRFRLKFIEYNLVVNRKVICLFETL
jgi:hypothetical protein